MAAEPSPDPAGPELLSLAADIDVDRTAWDGAGADLESLCQQMARTTFNRVQADLDFSGHAASGVELAMRLTTDRELQTLNLQFRGLDKPTNVLSFAALDGQESPFPDAAPLYLGDIAIAAETVAGEARDQQKSVVDHLAHMVVHGTLHLLGYDHEDAGEAEEMEALEREILKRHGIDDPYQDQEMAK